jgi:hypothetical protein
MPMPRIIGADRNEIIFDDPLSGDRLGMYYRMPTTREREGFVNMAVRRKGNKVTMHHAEARMCYGMKILVGIREGDFMRMASGQPVPMSSDPSSPHYTPEWAQEMEAGCADLIMALAAQVFDVTPRVAVQEDEEPPTDEGIEGE